MSRYSRYSQRRRRLTGTVFFLTFLLVLVGALVFARTDHTGLDTAQVAPGPAPTGDFYLAIGASASLGFQPTGIVKHNGRRTPDGYANDLVYLLSLRGVALKLIEVGCPGETVTSILSTVTEDACYHAPQTQLTKSLAYLRTYHDNTGVVTVDLGFNDIRPCLTTGVIDESCVTKAVSTVQTNLPIILKSLKAAAGPHVEIVGLLYNDPYLGFYIQGSSGPGVATATLDAMNEMNGTLNAAYRTAGVLVANVPALFDTDDNSRVVMDNVGEIPTNVEAACEYTWFCTPAPFGPDDHPNDAGYALIAQAINSALRAPL